MTYLTPPHLIPDAEPENDITSNGESSRIGRQGVSKYGPGGRRRAKAKGRKK